MASRKEVNENVEQVLKEESGHGYQIVGYGSAGLYRKLLVEPAQMWWPHTLVNVSLFR